MPKQETIFFYHLPKTAGQTMTHILRQNYAPDEMVGHGIDTHAFVEEFNQWPAEKRNKINLMHGHFPFGLHDSLPQKTRCFTMLRHPVERTISYYFHAKRQKQHYLHDLIHDNGWSLKELLDSGLALMMNDAQVRLLSGVWGEPRFGEVDESMLQTAVSNLRQCELVGLTEAFDQSLLLLQKRFGWQHILYTRRNVGTNRVGQKEMPPETIATIQKCNQLDAHLYAEAERLFHKAIAAEGWSFGVKTAVFRLKLRFSHSPLSKFVKI